MTSQDTSQNLVNTHENMRFGAFLKYRRIMLIKSPKRVPNMIAKIIAQIIKSDCKSGTKMIPKMVQQIV